MSGYQNQKRKRRIRQFINFIAFNLLFFALYLNFYNNELSSVEKSDPEAFHTATIVKKQEQFNVAAAANKLEMGKKSF